MTLAECLKDDPTIVAEKVKDMESDRKTKVQKVTHEQDMDKRRMALEERRVSNEEEARKDARAQQSIWMAMMQTMQKDKNG